MEIHTACQSAASPAGDAGNYYTYAGFLGMDNGDGDDGDAILVPDHAAGSIIPVLLADFRQCKWRWRKVQLPGTPDQLLVTTVVGLLASAMENGEGSLPPASSIPCHGSCLLTNNVGEGWQWSQWREPRIPKRYTVSFEGRSWL